MEKALFFNYKIIQKFELLELDKYSSHRRLQVFFHKGCKCVSCDNVGTNLALGVDRKGNKHLDLYCENGVPMTIDHIDPKSKGGSNHLSNYQPMCFICNQRKGNGDEKNSHYFENIMKKNSYTKESINIGDLVFTKRLNKRGKPRGMKELGIVDKFIINPYTNKESVMFVDNNSTMIDLRKLYKIKKYG
jgi:hypothetical protein